MPRVRERLGKPVKHPKRKAAIAKKSAMKTETQAVQKEQNRKPMKRPGVAESNRRRIKHPWDSIEPRYIQGYEAPHPENGQMVRYWPTMAELCDEFRIPIKTMSDRSVAYKWVDRREEFRAALKKAAEDADLLALKEAELRIRRKSLKAAEKIIDRVGGTQLVQGEAKDLVDIIDPSDLASLGTALRRGQEVANVAIGIPKDGVKAPGSDAPGGETKVTVWARMRDSRQDVVVGVQIVNE